VRFLTSHDLAAGDLADKVEKVRLAIERDDFRSPDVKKLGQAQFYRASSTTPRACCSSSSNTAGKGPALRSR
jgi:hypothetical protein